MNKLFTLAIVCLLFAGCRESAPPTSSEVPVPVHIVGITPASGGGTIQVAGLVEPKLEADLAAQIVAPVAAVTKREGDHFHKGEVLVRFHAPALDANVAQANAALSGAEKQAAVASSQEKLAAETLQRYAQLRERHSVTPYERDQIQAQAATAHAQQQGADAQVAAARSNLEALRASASDATLYAPFDGVVTKRMVDPGAMATPGLPLLHVQSAGERDVAFSVPDNAAASLKVGSIVLVTLAGGNPLKAAVAHISPAGSPGSHSFAVKADLPVSTSLNTGTVVQVLLPSGHQVSRILIPLQAVVQQGGLDAVLIATADSHAQIRYVTLGTTAADTTEVLSGLRNGDRILAKGDIGLAGRKIEVQP